MQCDKLVFHVCVSALLIVQTFDNAALGSTIYDSALSRKELRADKGYLKREEPVDIRKWLNKGGSISQIWKTDGTINHPTGWA